MLEKPLIFSGIGGKITNLTTVTLLEMKYVSKNSYLGSNKFAIFNSIKNY